MPIKHSSDHFSTTKSKVKIGSLILALTACMAQTQPLPEASFRAMMDFEIASEIAQNCPKFRIASVKSPHDALTNELINGGKSKAEAAALMEQSSRTWGAKYKTAYANVVPISSDDPNYYCKYGTYEQMRYSAIGLLLVSNLK